MSRATRSNKCERRPVRLFLQIPCLNEAATLPAVIADLPRRIEGVEEIYTLLIDDGSKDETVEVARRLSVDFIVQNGRTRGLATAFSKGLEACLFLGADVIVNTDGDNQYEGGEIAKLVSPILRGEADVVIGCRNIAGREEFSPLKKLLQRFGSKVVSLFSGMKVPDATSGFRAVSRAAAIKLCFVSSFSYTLEMLIQSGKAGLRVGWVPIRSRPTARRSRLFNSTHQFVLQQAGIMLKTFLLYYPMRFFGMLAAMALLVSLVAAARIGYYLAFVGPEAAKFKAGTGTLLQISSGAMLVFVVAGLLGSVLCGLRSLLLDLRGRLRGMELLLHNAPPDCRLETAAEFFRWKQCGQGHPGSSGTEGDGRSDVQGAASGDSAPPADCLLGETSLPAEGPIRVFYGRCPAAGDCPRGNDSTTDELATEEDNPNAHRCA